MFETKSIPKFLKISEINLRKLWNGPLCRNKSGPFPLLNIAAYLQNSYVEAFVKKLSQILTNSIDNGGKRDWSQNLSDLLSKKLMKIKGGLENPGIFLLKLTILNVWNRSNGFMTNCATLWSLWLSKKPWSV